VPATAKSDDARSGRSTGAPPLPPFAPTFEALVAKVGGATPPEEVVALHKRFEERTGAFGPDDPWFESRSRAFWDDTMTREAGRAWHVRALALDGGESAWAEALSRSHRGLFRAREDGGRFVLVDVLSGAELLLNELDQAARDALRSSRGLLDGTVVAHPTALRLALLPGAIFHAEEADDAILAVLVAARTRDLSRHRVLDALLRMELSFRTLSRVKPSYAYRAEALGA
jgi:hypothetical protein